MDNIATYNQKAFLAPQSIDSMSAVHAKVYEDGKAVLRLSDCHGSIRYWNHVNTATGKQQFLMKLESLREHINAMEAHIKNL